MRFRLAVRGAGLELRGFIEDDDTEDVADRIATLAHGMRRLGAELYVTPIVDDTDPFR